MPRRRKAISPISAKGCKGAAELTPAPDRALLALQGPLAADVLERHSPGISQLTFMQAKRVIVAGAPAIVSRTGYTGEDGFEISHRRQGRRARRPRASGAKPKCCRSGWARATVSGWKRGFAFTAMTWTKAPIRWKPISSGRWASAAKRRAIFPAPDRITEHLLNGADKKRVGLRPEGRAPAREGTEIADKSGRVVGRVTSGGFGPSLNAPLAMGYVESEFAANGTKLDLLVRGKALAAEVVAMPFVPNRYKRAKK